MLLYVQTVYFDSSSSNLIHVPQENGVFAVLERGWIQALELIITSEVSLPLRVLEKYTYHFHYGERNIQSISIPGYGNVSISLDTIIKQMRSVIKYIIKIDRVLPRLPGRLKLFPYG
jgi:HORMA domain